MVKGLLKKIASAGLLIASLAGCGNGVPVWGDYPELTPKIKASLEKRVLKLVENDSIVSGDESKEKSVVPFEGTPKELLNYFIDFTQKDYAAKGMSSTSLHSVSLSIIPSEDIEDACNGPASACNNVGQIIMPNNFDITLFFKVFNHEFGHQIYRSNMEFPSMSNEVYSAIKAYEFSRKIGSQMLREAMQSCEIGSFKDSNVPPSMYTRGRLFSILNLNDNSGDIERAMDYVSHAELLEIETRLDKDISENDTGRVIGMCFDEWNNLLGSPNFVSGLMSNSHLNLDEAKELADYMRVLNYQMTGSSLSRDGIEAEYEEVMDSFEKKDYANNPYFRADVVYKLTLKRSKALNDLVANGDFVSDKVYDISKKIIEINDAYPCAVEDTYECPKYMGRIMTQHGYAYYASNYAAFKGSDDSRKQEALSYAIDFITRFYPGVDFNNGDFTALANVEERTINGFLPPIATHAGIYALSSSKELAKNLFTAAATIKCPKSAFSHPSDNCTKNRSIAQTYLNSF